MDHRPKGRFAIRATLTLWIEECQTLTGCFWLEVVKLEKWWISFWKVGLEGLDLDLRNSTPGRESCIDDKVLVDHLQRVQ